MGCYILVPEVALRSWEGSPYAYIRRGLARPKQLSRAAFETALCCDGKTAVPESRVLNALILERLVRPCEPGEASLTDWQRVRTYRNRMTPWLALEITGRCNYNCLHCFNAADNEQLQTELRLDQIRNLLDEAALAGVQAVLLTGGEPLVHREFRNIVRAVYKRDMFLHEINTNGSLLNRELLDFLQSMGKLPELKISFDGLGFHDRMRGKKGAEEEALRALRLCTEAHAPVRVQMNVNRMNLDTLRPSLELLAAMDVPRVRVIPTAKTPRWENNMPDGSLTWEEYYVLALETAAWYAESGIKTELAFWQFLTLRPDAHAYKLNRVRYGTWNYREDCPICPTLLGMPAIGADGQIYPCMQYSGTMTARGVSFGNALEKGLISLLTQGDYCEQVHARVAQRLKRGEKCADCCWHTWCAGGCPALGYLYSGTDFLAHDPTACLFFENGWAQRVQQTLQGWVNLTPLT